MAVLSHLEPNSVFSFFETICSIPHPSYHEEQIAAYLEQFAKERDLEHYRDAHNNVIIIKEATPGYENEAPVILQGHTDMVCEQDAGRNIDFLSEGLDLFVEDGWVGARGTTLGGDDGVAVAFALALLDSKDIPHPRLEVVLTTSEEVGMEGAASIDLSMLKGRRLLNLDGEEEGTIMASCAGGCRVDGTLPVLRSAVSGVRFDLSLTNLTGGHSGTEIHRGRANASRVLGELMLKLSEQFHLRLLSMKGGTKDNAIPRDCFACVLLPEEQADAFPAAAAEIGKLLQAQYAQTDPNWTLTCSAVGVQDAEALTVDSTITALKLLQEIPNGVQAMSENIPGLVQTSLNLGILELKAQALEVHYSLRSSVLSEKDALKAKVCAIIADADGETGTYGDYPPWEYRTDSPLREDLCKVYRALYHAEPTIVAIHAGVECGLLSEKLPGMDAVSIGPNMRDIHTSQERLNIASVGRMWEFVKGVLAVKHA